MNQKCTKCVMLREGWVQGKAGPGSTQHESRREKATISITCSKSVISRLRLTSACWLSTWKLVIYSRTTSSPQGKPPQRSPSQSSSTTIATTSSSYPHNWHLLHQLLHHPTHVCVLELLRPLLHMSVCPVSSSKPHNLLSRVELRNVVCNARDAQGADSLGSSSVTWRMVAGEGSYLQQSLRRVPDLLHLQLHARLHTSPFTLSHATGPIPSPSTCSLPLWGMSLPEQ
eukprot:747532-Hanusia_phi.AAC.1